MPATRDAPMPEDDCQYTDIHGTAVYAPTITNIAANLTPKHYAIATLTLLTTILATATTTYLLLTSTHPLVAALSPFHNLHYSPTVTFGSSSYQYTAALQLAQTENTDDITLPPILPTPALPLVTSQSPDKDAPNCWSPALYQDYLTGKLYAQFFNQRRLWGNPLYTLHDVLVLVTTAKHHHRTRCDVMMCTWVGEFPPGHVIFVSDDEDELHQVPVINVMKGQDLTHSHEDTNRLTPRGWKVAYDIGRQLGVSWYYRMDDDTFLAPNNLVRVINQHNHTTPLMTGQKCDLQPGGPFTNIYRFCGGGGELLSSSMLDLIAPFFFDQCDPRNGDAHDVFLPRCITDRTHIEPTDHIEFGSQPPEFYYRDPQGPRDRVEGFGKAVSFHYIRPWPVYMWLYKLYQAFQS